MEKSKPRYTKDEFARRGDMIFENDVRPKLTAKDEGKFVALDIETGTFVVAGDELSACHRLREKIADAQIWMTQIGSGYLHRFGHAQ